MTIQSQPRKLGTDRTDIRVRGKLVRVVSANIDGRTVVTKGKWLKIAAVQDEELVEGEVVPNPQSFISQLKVSGLNADIFTFAETLPETTPRHAYYQEWDNLAVIPITTFSDWWEKRAAAVVRTAVRKAAKLGVIARLADFDDTFVKGIVNINNETPTRQGKAFWHFQKDFAEVKLENSTYAGRNAFLGAYYAEELIGFIRIIYAGRVANIVQLLTMTKHFDKRPANALVAKAVELCAQKGIHHLTYCNYTYNDPKSSLTEFKRRNGFEQVLVPRYYIPMTFKGEIAVRLRLHQGLVRHIPKPLFRQLLHIRRIWLERKNSYAQTACRDQAGGTI